MVETRKDPNKPWNELSGLSPREGSTQSKSRTKCIERCGWSNGHFWASSASEILAACSFDECKFRGSESLAEQRHHFVLRGTTQGPPQETKDLEVAEESLRYSWHESSVCDVFGGSQRTRSSERRIGAMVVTGEQRWRREVFLGEMASFFPFSGVGANDLVQWMREAFRVRVCERVDPGFLTTVEFMRRKVAWNAEDFFWIYDPTKNWLSLMSLVSLARSNLSKRRASLWHPVRKRWTKVYMTVQTSWTNEKHNNASLLLAQHWMLDRTDQKHNMQRKNQRYSCLIPRVLWSVWSNVCVSTTAKHPCTAGVFHIKKCSARSKWWQRRIGTGNWRDCRRRALGFILVVICWRRILQHSRLWRCQLRRASTSR